jgi:hypothetical protein
MRILVNGSSVSSGEFCWPAHIKSQIDCELINLSLAGAGNTYISESTIAELSEREYDLVLIMWADNMRMDFKIHDHNDFSNTFYTSFAQCMLRNRTTPEFEYIQKDWVFGVSSRGTNATSAESTTKELFDGYYRFTSNRQHVFSSLIKIISLQNTLKTLNIPYLFMNYHPFAGRQRFPKLFEMIDWTQVHGEHLHTIATSNHWWDSEHHHPTLEAYKNYADLVIQRIEQTTGNLVCRA